ncbi:MAG TPA: VCBS repeat-containing protein [Ohtaekwangia sp.]|nr:VCBS repeat-containing protein [Ohtaekwangia sp.]
MIRRLIIYAFVALLAFAGCGTPERSRETLFTRIPSSETGITFTNTNKEDVNENILTYEYFYNGGGVAIGDINNDGLPDIYFSANQEENKLYLNKGNFRFEDITQKAGVSAKSGWRTGVAMADVNGDGYLDIYVCKSGAQHPLFRTNALFINNKDLTFTDKANAYGLDDDSYSTQASFLDYDKDGDMDLFLLNHSRLMISNSFDISTRYGTARERYVGNKIYRNDGGKFMDVSDSLGIFGPASNYGLGVAYGDINNDGWLDIYTSNDYTERDKLYLNSKGQFFSEVADSLLTHMSQFSMGVDIADINNDGWLDILSVDMLPETNRRQKEFHWPDRYDVYAAMVKNGRHHQYMRNMLQVNNGNGTFSEVGQLAGISNTDWSWSALFADYDNDGLQDLFIASGFKRNFTSNDFLKYRADNAIKIKTGKDKGALLDLLEKMPASKTHSYMFRNSDGLKFADASREWGFTEASLANGAAYADLDNDGDLDLITNNIDEVAGVYRNNQQERSPAHYIKVKLQGNDQNTFGFGAKVNVYAAGKMMTRTLSPQRGFQSSVEPVLHFGLGSIAVLDSVIVQWPRGEREKLVNVRTDQMIQIHQRDAEPAAPIVPGLASPLFVKESTINAQHQENEFVDFKVQALLPRMYSTSGPSLASADVNGDAVRDLYLGGAKGQEGMILIQKNGSYTQKKQIDFELDANSEDTDALFFDMDADGDQDLYVVSGGYEFLPGDPLIQDRLYRNDGKGNFRKEALPAMLSSGSCVRAADIDGDGDQDLFVGGRIVPGRYPLPAESYLLLNDGQGKFEDVTDRWAASFRHAGMITDAAWMDLNNDNKPDLVIVGEWMPISLYINEDGKFVDRTRQFIRDDTRGWWNCIRTADLDNDGDLDIVAGNFGMNNQFKPSSSKPVTLYYGDYDENGSIDPVMCYFIGDKSYPLATRDELIDQVPAFRKKFPDYGAYMEATISDILTADQLNKSTILTASTFTSSYLLNEGGFFTLRPLPDEAQIAPIHAVQVMDANGDGSLDLVTGGNLSAARSRFGKAAGNFGDILLGDGSGGFSFLPSLQGGLSIRGDVRAIVRDDRRLIFSLNDARPVVYRLK